MTERQRYTVRAAPEGKFWVLRIEGLPEYMAGVSQALDEHGPDGIEAMARDAIALLLEVDKDSFDLLIIKQHPDPELAARLQRGIEQAKRGETHDLGDFSQYLEESEGETG